MVRFLARINEEGACSLCAASSRAPLRRAGIGLSFSASHSVKSDHSTALVPIESWAFSAPELRDVERKVDIAQLAEALLYYNKVLLNVANEAQLGDVFEWFIVQERFETLLALLRDETIQIYVYSFHTSPVLDEETARYEIWNLTSPVKVKPNSFEERVLASREIRRVVAKVNWRNELNESLRGRVIEAKADVFGSTVEEARRDFADAERTALTLQAFVDELYIFRDLGRPPTVREQPGWDGGPHRSLCTKYLA